MSLIDFMIDGAIQQYITILGYNVVSGTRVFLSENCSTKYLRLYPILCRYFFIVLTVSGGSLKAVSLPTQD